MKIFKLLLRTTLFLVLMFSLVSGLLAQSAEEGKTLYQANCTSCHAINEKVVGPALKDVHKRREEAWLVKWIRNSQKLIQSGDPIAVQLYKENNESPMTAFEQLSDVQIKSIITYIKSESEAPAKTAVIAGTTTAVGPTDTKESEFTDSINWLLVLISVLLIAVIIYVFGILSKIGDIEGKKTVNWNSINSKLMLIFVVVGLLATVWEFMVHGKLTYFNEGSASVHGEEYDNMFMITLVITGVVFIITQILLFWYGFKYKADGKRKALYYPDNHKLELWWTIIPAIVLTVLVIRGLITWTNMTTKPETPSRNIEVFAYQFGWNARYAGADNKLGRHNFREVGKVNPLGVDTNDANAYDDIVVSELHLEVNQPIEMSFRAKDVIHSAYFPHFRTQMNVVPGLPTRFNFTPSVTTAEMRTKKNDPNFDYILLCNKICGGAHYRMKMKVIVDTKEEYQKWLSTQPALVAGKVSNSPVAMN
jgi:cytochrome c oxidase subunit 2